MQHQVGGPHSLLEDLAAIISGGVQAITPEMSVHASLEAASSESMVMTTSDQVLERAEPVLHEDNKSQGEPTSGGHKALAALAARLVLGRNVSLLLLAMVEGREMISEPNMMQQLSLTQMHEASLRCRLGALILKKRAAAETEPRGKRAELEQMATNVLDTGFNLHLLLHELIDFQNFHKEAMRVAPFNPFDEEDNPLSSVPKLAEEVEKKLTWEKLQELAGAARQELAGVAVPKRKGSWRAEALEYFEAYTARVEIVNSDGELERVYFHYPEMCELLTQESRHDVLWGVDRETPGKALIEFFYKADSLHLEMKHQQWLRRFYAWRVLSSYKETIIHGSFWLAVVQNAMLMMRLSTEDMQRTEYLAIGNTILYLGVLL